MLLKQFYYLHEIAQARSITAASERLFVTQQTLSTSIKNLEIELGTTLLNRRHNGVTLTSDGEYVLNAAEQILAIVEDLTERFTFEAADEPAGEIRLTLSPGLRQTIFPKIFSHYYKNHPHITLRAVNASYDEAIQALLEQRADISLITLPMVGKQYLTSPPPQLIFAPLNRQSFIACVSKDSPLAQYRSTSLAVLLKYPLIMRPFQPLAQFPLYQILQRYGEPQVILADTAALVHQMLCDNNGVALLNEPPSSNVTALKIRDNIAVSCGYLLPAALEPSPLLTDFIFHLTQLLTSTKTEPPVQ